MQNKDNSKTYLIIGGLILVYFAGDKIFKALGLSTDKSKKEEIKAIDNSYQAAIAAQKPTKSGGEWAQIANIIYEDLKYTSLDDNKKDAIYQCARAKNDADVWTLIKFFDERQEYAFNIPLGDKKSLPVFITTNIDRGEIDKLNDNYRRKGIKYRF